MPTVTEFLEARIAEDEATALAVSDPDIRSVIWCAQNDGRVTSGEASEQGDFVERQSPARVLAECAAKRAIIREHGISEIASLDRATWGQMFIVCRTCAVGPRQIVSPCPTLRHVAAVYADHPDYQQDWAQVG